jgi:hypothetical protein
MSQKTQIAIFVVVSVLLAGVIVYQLARKEVPPPSIGGTVAKTQGTTKAQGAARTGAVPPSPTGTAAKGESASASASSPQTQIRKVDVNIDELLANIKEVDFDYEKERLPRDPMAPLVGTLTRKAPEGTEEQPAAPPTAVQVMNKAVSGIVWDERHPLAVVDNEVVYPGYVYADGVTVESVERDRVVFKVGDSLIQNPLKEF